MVSVRQSLKSSGGTVGNKFGVMEIAVAFCTSQHTSSCEEFPDGNEGGAAVKLTMVGDAAVAAFAITTGELTVPFVSCTEFLPRFGRGKLMLVPSARTEIWLAAAALPFSITDAPLPAMPNGYKLLPVMVMRWSNHEVMVSGKLAVTCS